MFRLKLATDPRWAQLVERDFGAVLTDHAWCEQKAASNAISIIIAYPEYEEMVTALSAIAVEEMQHFQQVHAIMRKRGYVLGAERKDDYVNELYKFMLKGKGRKAYLMDRLLFAAMIEARSCERFRVLSENIQDEELARFYRDLMISEANHYTVFLQFARVLDAPEVVEKRWEEWLAFEGELIAGYGKEQKIHG
jgi:tRNA 2-(methylsulfanyl)-N6-isopentenyladenosine37 hydroxylase